MAWKKVGNSQTEIQVNGTTEYGPSEQTEDTIYDVAVSTSTTVDTISSDAINTITTTGGAVDNLIDVGNGSGRIWGDITSHGGAATDLEVRIDGNTIATISGGGTISIDESFTGSVDVYAYEYTYDVDADCNFEIDANYSTSINVDGVSTS